MGRLEEISANSDNSIEWTLYALLSDAPPELLERCPDGWITRDPERIAEIAEAIEPYVGAFDASRIVAAVDASWGYRWDGSENDYDELRRGDGLATWLASEDRPWLLAAWCEGYVD